MPFETLSSFTGEPGSVGLGFSMCVLAVFRKWHHLSVGSDFCVFCGYFLCVVVVSSFISTGAKDRLE